MDRVGVPIFSYYCLSFETRKHNIHVTIGKSETQQHEEFDGLLNSQDIQASTPVIFGNNAGYCKDVVCSCNEINSL